MMYQLLYNNGAGKYEVKKWSTWEYDNWERSGYRVQYGHMTEVGLFSDSLELEEAISELAGPDVWAVYYNVASGEGFVSIENGVSGNWRGSKHGHYSLIAEYNAAKHPDAEELAYAHLRSRRGY